MATFLQESVSAICKSVMPLWERYFPRSPDDCCVIVGREAKQEQNLKIEQQLFHRLLNLVCLRREGLASEEELKACRLQVLDYVKTPGLIYGVDDEECEEVTKDKLVFLQDLLFAGCICEEEYHDAKRPLILSLAKQGAYICSQDVILPANHNLNGKETIQHSSPAQSTKSKCSPMKQVMDAVTRGLNKNNSKCGADKEMLRVPHALDFLRPKDCPVRSPPSLPPSGASLADKRNSHENASGELQDDVSASLPPKPPAHMSPLKFQSKKRSSDRQAKNIFVGLLRKVHGGNRKSYSSSEDSDLESPEAKVVQRFNTSCPSSNVQADESSLRMGEFEDFFSTNRILAEKSNGQGPNIVKLRKKIHSDGASTDFFIDKVLGENIKCELSRIRAEMKKTNSGQMFTNEQIDAIATRLPIDKSELKNFFPRAWCDRYGEVVLDVVRKEFKNHVKEMGRPCQAGKEEHPMPIRTGENDENDRQESSVMEEVPSCRKISVRKCFTVLGNDNEPTNSPLKFSSNLQEAQLPKHTHGNSTHYQCIESMLEDDIQGKLGEEIQKMPTTINKMKKKTPMASSTGTSATRHFWIMSDESVGL